MIGYKMEFSTIIVEVKDFVAKITLNRPEVLNCFNECMHEELRSAFDIISHKKKVRAVLLTGAGRAFSSGQDLRIHAKSIIQGEQVDPRPSLDRDFNPLVLLIQNLEIPTVAAVNGIAAGAAANIALSCDFVIAARSAKFIQAFTRIGLVPDSGGTYFLPRLVGMARARGLLMLGEPVTAEQAMEWGMIWKCVDDENFYAEIDNFMAALSEKATKAVMLTKEALDMTSQNTLQQQINLERDLQIKACQSADFCEGVTAFVEKRPARFLGR